MSQGHEPKPRLSRRALILSSLALIVAPRARADGMPENNWCVAELPLIEKLLAESVSHPLVTGHMRGSVQQYIQEIKKMNPVNCDLAAERRDLLRVSTFLKIMGTVGSRGRV